MNIKKFVVENTYWLTRGFYSFGWGNGYVLVPKEHPFFRKLEGDIDVSVHGGITYADEVTKETIERIEALGPEDEGMWMIGFDTVHSGDNLEKWPKEAVEEETNRLYEQVLEVFQ